MNRNFLFWSMVVCLLGIPNGILGWLRGKALVRTYGLICSELKQVGIELSQPEAKLLFSQLSSAPGSALSAEQPLAAQTIKRRRIEELVAYTKALNRYKWMVFVIGAAAVIAFLKLVPVPS